MQLFVLEHEILNSVLDFRLNLIFHFPLCLSDKAIVLLVHYFNGAQLVLSICIFSVAREAVPLHQ